MRKIVWLLLPAIASFAAVADEAGTRLSGEEAEGTGDGGDGGARREDRQPAALEERRGQVFHGDQQQQEIRERVGAAIRYVTRNLVD